MKIRKILNNNLVLVQDGEENEVIVKGNGVGFNKKRGDIVEESIIEKIFTPNSPKNSKEMQNFLTSIPEEYLDFVQNYVDQVKNDYNMKLNNSIYILGQTYNINIILSKIYSIRKSLSTSIYIQILYEKLNILWKEML